MSKVKAWVNHDDDTKWIWDDQSILFEAVDATPEQVQQVCALPQIMAALKKLKDATEKRALAKATLDVSPGSAEAWVEYVAAGSKREAALDALLKLYERLK